jgi:hypothetical protein
MTSPKYYGNLTYLLRPQSVTLFLKSGLEADNFFQILFSKSPYDPQNNPIIIKMNPAISVSYKVFSLSVIKCKSGFVKLEINKILQKAKKGT